MTRGRPYSDKRPVRAAQEMPGRIRRRASARPVKRAVVHDPDLRERLGL